MPATFTMPLAFTAEELDMLIQGMESVGWAVDADRLADPSLWTKANKIITALKNERARKEGQA